MALLTFFGKQISLLLRLLAISSCCLQARRHITVQGPGSEGQPRVKLEALGTTPPVKLST
jgi:hypothetical protein